MSATTVAQVIAESATGDTMGIISGVDLMVVAADNARHAVYPQARRTHQGNAAR